MTRQSAGEEQLRWVGAQYPGKGFSASVSRDEARVQARQLAQQYHDFLMRDWECKSKAQEALACAIEP